MSGTALTALRVAGHVALARLRRPRVTRAEETPWSVAALTPAWWTAVMCAAHPAAEVLDFTQVGASSGTHQRHRFTLRYNQAGHDAQLPTAVFTKSLPTVVNRMIGGYNGTARAEGRFYREIRRELRIESPHGYFSAFDRRTLAGINVLEDVATTRGVRFCDHLTPVTRAMAESMVDLLAALHAHALDDARLRGAWRWLANFADWFEIGARKMDTERYTAMALRRMADTLPARLLGRAREVWPATVAASTLHRGTAVGLIHSDVHIGNWYQTPKGAMGLYDWQCVAQGHGARDLAYALAAALAPADRRAWERDLVTRYADGLAAHSGRPCDRELLWRHYRGQMLHALWMWTITLCHSPLLPAMQPEATSRAMIERIALAIDDLDSLDAARGA
ncbi:MAG: phosphotransferase [Gammaproteobacteria bacterium]